jgi:hypothetical protein
VERGRAPSLITDIETVAWTNAADVCVMAWYTHHDGLLVQAGLVFSDGGLQYIPEGSGLRTLTMSEVYDAPAGSHRFAGRSPDRAG